MKATQKITKEVTEKAVEMGCPVDVALNTLNFCSMGMYKVLHAEGVVKSALQTLGGKRDLIAEVKYENPNYISRMRNN